MSKCTRQINRLRLHPVSLLSFCIPISLWCVHHPVPLTHMLALEQFWMYCLVF